MDAILTFHAIDADRSPVALPRESFERLLRALLDDGVHVVPLHELLAPGARGKHRVALTFDDGYRSTFTEALPVLARFGLPAIVYVVSSQVGGTSDWSRRAGTRSPGWPLMTWEELAAWKAQGLAIGAHTAHHVALTAGLSEEEWTDELQGCRTRLQDRLGAPVEDFAYPFGVAGDDARRRVAQVFRTAVTTRLAFVRPPVDALLLPRIDAWYLRRSPAQPLFAAMTRARLTLRRAGRGLRAAARR